MVIHQDNLNIIGIRIYVHVDGLVYSDYFIDNYIRFDIIILCSDF